MKQLIDECQVHYHMRGREHKVRARVRDSVRKVLCSDSSSDSDASGETSHSQTSLPIEAPSGVQGQDAVALSVEPNGFDLQFRYERDEGQDLSKAANDEFEAEIHALEHELRKQQLTEAERMNEVRGKICKLETLLESDQQTIQQQRSELESLNKHLNSEKQLRAEAEAELAALMKEAKNKDEGMDRRQKAIKSRLFRQHRHYSCRRTIETWRLRALALKQFRDVQERAQHTSSVAMAALASAQTLLREVVKEVEHASTEEQKRHDEMQRMTAQLNTMTSSGIRSSEIVSMFADTAGNKVFNDLI